MFNQNNSTAAHRLSRAKGLALLFLLIAIGLFVFALYFQRQYPQLAYLKAFAEAAIVGALADWFAVVALFRHPLGLPIPHTAILPRKQHKIAEEIGYFIEHNFLASSPIARRVMAYQPSKQLLLWLVKEHNKATVAQYIASYLPAMIKIIPAEKMITVLQSIILNKVQGQQLGLALSGFLHSVLKKNQHQTGLTMLAKALRQKLAEEQTQQYLQAQINAWVSDYQHSGQLKKLWNKLKINAFDLIDEWLLEKIIKFAENTLDDVIANPQHLLRQKWDNTILSWQEQAQHSGLWHRKMRALERSWLESDSFNNMLNEFIDYIYLFCEEDIQKTDSKIVQQLEKMILNLAEQGLDSPQWQQEINVSLGLLTRDLVKEYRSEASQFIVDKVKSWDNKELTEKLELSVGRDLQYIRINGTLVGGLVGLLIYSVSQQFY